MTRTNESAMATFGHLAVDAYVDMATFRWERSDDGAFLLIQSEAGASVSRNDQAQAGHEGESEAKKELVLGTRAERCALVSRR